MQLPELVVVCVFGKKKKNIEKIKCLCLWLKASWSHWKPTVNENVPVFLSYAVLHIAVEDVSSECL